MLLSIPKFAKHVGVTKKAVQDAIKLGRISTTKTGKRNLLETDTETDKWFANRNPANVKMTPSPQEGNDPVDFQQWRTKLEKNKALKAELEYKEKAGELVPANDVAKEAFNIGKIVKESLLGLPDRLSHEFAGEKNANKIARKLEKEILISLNEILKKVK